MKSKKNRNKKDKEEDKKDEENEKDIINENIKDKKDKKKNIKIKDEKHGEIACFEAGAFRYGNGDDGPAITIEKELKQGWVQKNSIFGNDICLLKDYKDDGEFEIDFCFFPAFFFSLLLQIFNNLIN